MNILLQDPFAVLKEHPEKLTHTIENPLRTECLQFSPCGDYLALGCANGALVIYDMDTFRPICVPGNMMGAHVRPITSIAWSPDGRLLLTSSRDWSIKLWDLSKPSKPLKEIRFDSPIWGCQWLDAKRRLCVATIFEESDAYVIDFSNDPVASLLSKSDEKQLSSTPDHGYVLVCTVHTKHPNIIIVGTSKGWLDFYKFHSLYQTECIHSLKITSSNIKHLIVSQNGERLAINCSDRTIRQYEISIDDENSAVELTLEHKYQDVINKLQWNCILFSNNTAEYLVASTHGSSAHELYIWETTSGTLVRVLEGAEEELIDINWDFYSMSIVSNGFESGNVYVWSVVIPPKWSALAPDFEEVEENVDYLEKEDEFDEVDEAEQQQGLEQEEEIAIDLRTREQYDVRGNNLLVERFTIPTDYTRIIKMQSS